VQAHNASDLARVGWQAMQQPILEVHVGRHPRAGAIEQPLDIRGEDGGHELIDRGALFVTNHGHRTGGWRLRIS
jgi:hypothetical protein